MFFGHKVIQNEILNSKGETVSSYYEGNNLNFLV